MRLDAFSEQVIEDWLARTPEDRHHLLFNALFSIIEGTWYQLYEHWDYLDRPASVAMRITDEEVMVWQVFLERPGMVRIWYIGRPD